MPSKILSTLIKLALACLVVGLILSLLGLAPAEFFRGLFDAARGSLAWGREALGWAFEYIVIGAAVVIPVWLALLVFRLINRG